jgi:hypothetical protein
MSLFGQIVLFFPCLLGFYVLIWIFFCLFSICFWIPSGFLVHVGFSDLFKGLVSFLRKQPLYI